ncbi:MAG: TnpV protein [Eubacteriales bacterium]|nr:TnpV protein [Eubacteriales bacterium]
MAKTIFEQMGGTYTQVGDYLISNLKLPAEETQASIGVWGMRHKRFLKENHRVLYANLMTSGKLVTYLDDIERQATTMFLRLVKELAEKENVTEELKATDQMLWVQKMNNIRNRATEIVNSELIYTV